jgi:deoxyadenosine/deoxycytidine kinase
MGKIVAVVGVTGAGKTTLVRALCRHADFKCGLEQHSDRPFQHLFKNDPQFALANQLDYLLLRAKQEQIFRNMPEVALVDGGLDLDFHGFTRLFYSRGFLSEHEFQLCTDFYGFLRSILPIPDMIIHLIASHDEVSARLANRERINIATIADLDLLDFYLSEWLAAIDQNKIFTVDATHDDMEYSKTIPLILDKITSLGINNTLYYK